MTPRSRLGHEVTRRALRRNRARKRQALRTAVALLLVASGMITTGSGVAASAAVSQVASATATPTPSPTPDPAVSPSPTPTPDPAVSPTPAPTPSPAPSPSPSPTPTQTTAPAPSPVAPTSDATSQPLAPLSVAAPLAATAAAFTCSSTSVYSVTNTGGIYLTNATTGVSTANGSFTVPAGDTINALALGQAGNYIWAIDQTAPAILRYDASTGLTTAYPPGGGITSLGLPTIAGAIDPSTGIYYYVWAPNPATGVWYLYGFNTNTNTGIGYIGQINGMGSSVNGDIAFDAAGNLYIVSNADLTSPGKLSRVNGPLPTTAGNVTLNATTISSSLPANGGQYNSVAFGPNGNIVIGTSDPAGATGYVEVVDPATGSVISQVQGTIRQIDMASCIYPNTMTLRKNLPSGRYAAGDQFTLMIGNVTSSANTTTTTGSATGIQSNVVGPLLGRSGQVYTISETAASGSLGNYTSTWSCVDQANGNAVVGSGNGTGGSFTMPNNTTGGAKIVCTITNTAAAPPSAFTCSSSTVYSVTIPGGIYQTNATTGATTANGAFTVPAGDAVNALALGQAGNFIWALDRTAGKILRFDASTGLTTTFGTNVTGSLVDVIAGAIDPLTGIYYYVSVPSPGVWNVYGFNTLTNTPIGSIGSISGMDPSSFNGDIAFDAAGNLYIVSNANDTASGIVSRVNGPLPTTQGNVTLAATTITSSLPGNVGQYNSVAFGPNGSLVIGATPSSGGSPTIMQVDPATGALLSSATGSTAWVDMTSCIYPNTMVLQKNLPSGRYTSTDQFTLTIGNVTSSANTATTTGSATGIQSNVVGPLLGRSGQVYTISETAASGSLGNYTSTWSCVDQANGSIVIASGNGTGGSFTMPNNTTGGAKIVCTITNTALPKTATVTLYKQVTDVNGNNPAPASGWTLGAATTATTGTVTASPAGTTAVTGANGATAPWTLTFGAVSARASVAVSETQQAGYTFKSGICTVTPVTGPPTTYTLTSAAAFSVPNIAGGSSVVCTYVNQPTAATISWQKVDSAATAHSLSGSVWTLKGPGASGPTLTVSDCVATPCTSTNDTDSRAGFLSVAGLAWGTYTLTETRAPAGYVLDSTPRTVIVSGTALTVNVGAIKNTQQSVPVIPLTGGFGADAYLIAGGLSTAIALGLVSLHFWRRRRPSETP